MFFLINFSTDFGLDEYGRYDTRKEAFESIAFSLKCNYDIEIDMSKYPFDDGDTQEICQGDVEVYFGNDWCNAYDCNCKDYYRIVELW